MCQAAIAKPLLAAGLLTKTKKKMITEETKCKILQVFGYTPECLNCANADTAMGEIFEQEYFTDPMSMLELFIVNCSKENFAELKEILTEQMS